MSAIQNVLKKLTHPLLERFQQSTEEPGEADLADSEARLRDRLQTCFSNSEPPAGLWQQIETQLNQG